MYPIVLKHVTNDGLDKVCGAHDPRRVENSHKFMRHGFCAINETCCRQVQRVTKPMESTLLFYQHFRQCILGIDKSTNVSTSVLLSTVKTRKALFPINQTD